jgi:hypothetical protein
MVGWRKKKAARCGPPRERERLGERERFPQRYSSPVSVDGLEIFDVAVEVGEEGQFHPEEHHGELTEKKPNRREGIAPVSTSPIGNRRKAIQTGAA